MKLIIVSRKDTASLNIFSNLLNYGYKEISEGYYKKNNAVIALINEDSIFANYIEKKIEKDINIKFDSIIFASRHSSEKKIPTLTAHTPGNFGKADYGGKDGELCFSMPEANKKAVQKMNELSPQDYAVSMEATHHGPITDLPSVFVEIGSSEENWKDEKAGEVVAEVIQSLLDLKPKKKAVGIGGGHYCPKFTELALKTEIAVGHVLPKYVEITEETIKKALEKNSGVDLVVMDWKGTPKRSIIKNTVEDLGYEVVKAKNLL
ncbi:MAG: D-tyrosyl-tRNA(Tyr) deacylase [Methanomicrobia archaeon]|nr:D-tyrosyl-tRNA(Tyr) deacylase [Methanomicrobia archaeon]